MKWLRDYFSLSKKEEKGMIVLIALILILFVLQYSWVYLVPSPKTYPTLKNPPKISKPEISSKISDTVSSEEHETSIFDFDPNMLDENGFLKLGLAQKIVDHIIHYREKGGQFHSAQDFKKIYGLSDEDYERLEPYIKIADDKRVELVSIDLNTADSVHLLLVKGIGPVFASRILAMRRNLGCFVSKDQLMDVYGIDKEKYDFIKSQVYLSKVPVSRIDLNKASLDQLKKNPYIRYKLANIIIKYRDTHGPFKTTEDLKNIYAIDEKLFNKIAPYVEVRN